MTETAMTNSPPVDYLVKGPNYRKRWLDLKDMPGFAISKLSTYFDKTPEGLADCRGFAFNPTLAPVTHDNLCFDTCDLSDCSFADCNLMSPTFTGCSFDRCDFSAIRMWSCRFIDCKFSNCSFTGQLGADGQYSGCTFVRCTFNGGKSRSIFGHDAKYTDCAFLKCRVQAVDFKSHLFRNCRFESKFSSVRFLGAHAISHLTGASPVVLQDCDLSFSVFKKVHFDADLKLGNTKLPLLEAGI